MRILQKEVIDGKITRFTIPFLAAFFPLVLALAILSANHAIASPVHQGRTDGPDALISAAQDLTSTVWEDLGDEIDTTAFDSVGVWLTLDINDSVNARVRVLAKHTQAGSEEYLLPIKTVGSSSVAIEDEYFEFTDDADGKYVLSWQLDGVVPYVQVQVQAETVNTTAAQIDAAYWTVGY